MDWQKPTLLQVPSVRKSLSYDPKCDFGHMGHDMPVPCTPGTVSNPNEGLPCSLSAGSPGIIQARATISNAGPTQEQDIAPGWAAEAALSPLMLPTG